MTDDEKFLFDLRGYLVLENVLPEEEVDAANAAIDEHKDLIVHGEPRLARDSEALKGTMSRGGFTQHPLSFDRPEPINHIDVDEHAVSGHVCLELGSGNDRVGRAGGKRRTDRAHSSK